MGKGRGPDLHHQLPMSSVERASTPCCLLAFRDHLQPCLSDHKGGVVQVGYVKGIDLSPGEIREAQKRFDEFSSQPKKRGGVKCHALHPCPPQTS